jgi:murein DD-endopeptidase MepM/ murein hydrolase activator NlpD
MQKSLSYVFLFQIVLSIVISVIIIPHIANSLEQSGVKVELTSSSGSFSFDNISSSSNTNYCWPSPGYKTITSYYGYRKAPTGGASTFHGGIDIGAAQGSKIVAIQDGVVSFVGWCGANGYTVKIKHANNVESTYGHVNPNFIVKVGDSVTKGTHIANVGPKYVAKKSYTTYKDDNGNATNGATTGPHLHLAISIKGKRVDPQKLF